MSKSTSLTAMSPPKILVIPRASRMFAATPFSSLTGASPQRVADVAALAAMQLLGSLAVGNDAFGPQEHQEDKEEAEQQEVVLRDVRLAERGAPYGVADGVDPHVDLRQQVEVEPLQDDGAADHAVDVPHSAEDDHTENDDRDVEREGVREDVLYERGVEGARDAAEDRPEGVGPQLRRHRVDAHRCRCSLVLAHRDPGPTQPGIAQANVDVDREQDQNQYRVVPGVQIQRSEALPLVKGIGQELQTRRVYGLDTYRAVGQVEAAEVVAILEDLRDDLPEPQGDYSQVVPPQPQGGRPDDDATQGGECAGEDQEYPEGEVYPLRLPAGDRGRSGPEGEAHLPELGGGEPPNDVGAKGVERHEAEVEQAGEPDDDVQAERKQDIDGDDDDGEDQVQLENAVDDREDESRHDEQRGQPVLPQQGHVATPRPPA